MWLLVSVLEGPGWSRRGLDQRAGRYPLQVEGLLLKAVDRLIPGGSTLTHYARYYSLYAATATHAAQDKLGTADCQRLVRRCEVLLAAASQVYMDTGGSLGPGYAHGLDRVRLSLGTDLDLAAATDPENRERSYSPRAWGFGSQYGGPSQTLGTVSLGNRAPRPGRHPCPPSVRESFSRLLSLTSRETLPLAEVAEPLPVALQTSLPSEQEWLGGLFTATRDGRHTPEKWDREALRRRATLRIPARSVLLAGSAEVSWEDAMRSAVAFGGHADNDPILRSIPETPGWRGVLPRHYSVRAWRRLWALLVRLIGPQDGDTDRSREEPRAWLTDQMPDVTVRALFDALPSTMAGRHPAPAEREVLAAGDRMDALTNVSLLLLGARRSEELTGTTRGVFLGDRHGFLAPDRVHRQVEEHRYQSMREFAARLVDDMLAQSQRAAPAKLRPGSRGRLVMRSRVHERNGRYYKTGDEGDVELGMRISQLAGIAVQGDLLTGDRSAVAPRGHSLLEAAA